MQGAATVRGRLRGRVIELEEPLDEVQEGEVEVQVRSVQGATPRTPDVLEVIASLPEGHRSRADIDRQVGEERSGWTDRG